ncbi:MAG: hypothetical protein RQ885_08255 [Desulfurococcales archaeon]|jgi:hypothetical protein|nr:hypothetical protein [Desulfurococcales archaeon]
MREQRDESRECLEAEVYISGKMAMITTKDGKKAVVPLRILCELAKRFGICYKNYKC